MLLYQSAYRNSTSLYIYIYLGADKEKLFNDQDLL